MAAMAVKEVSSSATGQLEKLDEEMIIFRIMQRARKAITPVKDRAVKRQGAFRGHKKLMYQDSIPSTWNTKCVCGTYHPPVPIFRPPDGERFCNYYVQISEVFPKLSIHTVLLSEIRFMRSDKQSNGVLEMDDIKRVIKSMGRVDISDSMIDRSFRQVDVDKNNCLDFIEFLTVMNSFEKNPSVIQMPNAQTSVCSIQ